MSIPYVRLKNNADLHFLTTGKPALEDFLTGNGTALSPPLYLCIISDDYIRDNDHHQGKAGTPLISQVFASESKLRNLTSPFIYDIYS